MKKFLCLALMAALMMALATTAFAATGTATVTADGTLTYSASNIEGWVEIYAGDVDGNPIAIHGEEVKDAVIEGTTLKVGDYLSYADLKSTTKVVIEAPKIPLGDPAYDVTFDEKTMTGTFTPKANTKLLDPVVVRYALSYFDTRIGPTEGVGDIALATVLNVAEDGSGTFVINKKLNEAQMLNLVYLQIVTDPATVNMNTEDVKDCGHFLWTAAQ